MTRFQKYAELIFLYNGRKMHAKALQLLQQYVFKLDSLSARSLRTTPFHVFNRLSEKEDEMRDKLGPSISYLQKLGPEYLDQIFESARWVFEQDRDMAFEVCPHVAFSAICQLHDALFILDI